MLVSAAHILHILFMETSTRNTSCVALIREALRARPSPAGKNNVAKNIERDLMPYIRELLQHRLSIGAYLSIRQTDSLVFGGVAEHIFRASLREFFSQAPIAKEQQWCAWPEEATKEPLNNPQPASP